MIIELNFVFSQIELIILIPIGCGGARGILQAIDIIGKGGALYPPLFHN
jgi:hypothetical protein